MCASVAKRSGGLRLLTSPRSIAGQRRLHGPQRLCVEGEDRVRRTEGGGEPYARRDPPLAPALAEFGEEIQPGLCAYWAT